MMRSEGVVMITRDGKPAGFFLPWDRPDVPDDLSRGIYEELSARASTERKKKKVTEEQILADFKTARRARR